MLESAAFHGPFAVYVQRTPTGAVSLRQPIGGGDASVIYIPPERVRDVALALARIAAERVG